MASLSMDPLPLTLALLAITAATAATTVPPGGSATPVVVALDMAPDSFDDQYRGCGRTMAAALPALNRSELQRGGHLAEAWALAAAEWRVRLSPESPPSPLSPSQATALLAYTAPVPLHRAFNAAVRVAGRSGREYRDNFHFKALHFLLTDALATLRDTRGHRCHRVFRGVSGVRFEARRGRSVRFGHFASASLRNESSWGFGTDTAFTVHTCQGVPIREFSFFPHEDEVLIPPFETFEVTGVTNVTAGGGGARIELRSTGTFSNYNCQWLREQRCGDGPCVFDTGRSTPPTSEGSSWPLQPWQWPPGSSEPPWPPRSPPVIVVTVVTKAAGTSPSHEATEATEVSKVIKATEATEASKVTMATMAIVTTKPGRVRGQHWSHQVPPGHWDKRGDRGTLNVPSLWFFTFWFGFFFPKILIFLPNY
ncbi:erythroblast NAD(P)(+)--arginine ADP-ribosyltransferase-like [Oenanthe melanoleuca]|uniref:erythroblast NAD(P)(+)--arginine ADP-ribosyltransferase-like n=1 Tax=Oenanthe melanoleuca TaxID=2939378 RepID=UPI0024C14E6F|nr:erythroblast NAD(P)(+)--arginine ADP-ribosyltransferase-like [Oenanthe melanoleuca]